ncbi:MAG: PAS domain-containing protein, partial [Bacteroidota bacterium]
MLSNTSDELLPKIEKIANLGLYEVNIPSGIWRGSDNFIKIFGLSKKEQYTQEEFQAIVHPEDFEDVMGYYQHCLGLQKDFNYEYRCVRPDGEVICVSSRSKITYSNDGTPQKVVGIKQDISEHKKTERKLQQLNKLIQRKDEILGEVAHDLRAPLAQIMMLAMFFEHRLKGKDRELFQLLKQTCLTTEDIISELIEIAQLE